VAQEVDRLLIESEDFVQFRHRHCVQVVVLPSVWIVDLDALHVLVKLEALSLLKHAHEA